MTQGPVEGASPVRGPVPRRVTPAGRAVFLGIAALFVFVLLQGGLFRPGEWLDDPGNSAEVFPGVIVILLALCGLWLGLAGDGVQMQAWPRGKALAAVAVLAGIFVYVELFRLLGFALSSALLLLAMPVALGYRNLLVILAFALPLLALVWLVFVTVMGVPLPAGTLWR